MPRTCRYCGQPFDVPPRASRRRHCYAPACLEARQATERGWKRDYDRRLTQAARQARAEGTPASRPATAPARVRQLRPCLRCDQPFRSRGAENRICWPCRASDGFRRARRSLVPTYW